MFFERLKFNIVASSDIKILNILGTDNSRTKKSENWDYSVLTEHTDIRRTVHGHFKVIRCTCKFSKIGFSKRHSLYNFGSFSANVLIDTPYVSAHKG